MKLLHLFWEYLLVGLFSFGGGMATIPFLQDMGERTGWFTQEMLADMIAISESTPGPIGVNMATYVGYTTAGPLGAVAATLAFAIPGLLFSLAVAAVLRRFRSSNMLERVFFGLRPVSTALIASALVAVAKLTLLVTPENSAQTLLNWPAAAIFLGVFLLTNLVPRIKKAHPVLLLAASALLGVLFKALFAWNG